MEPTSVKNVQNVTNQYRLSHLARLCVMLQSKIIIITYWYMGLSYDNRIHVTIFQ